MMEQNTYAVGKNFGGLGWVVELLLDKTNHICFDCHKVNVYVKELCNGKNSKFSHFWSMDVTL